MTELLRELEAVAGLMSGFDRQRFTAELERWFRTHHAEIAEAVKDARRFRWFINAIRDDGCALYRCDALGIDACNKHAIAAIDNAMHNSAREDGE